MRICFPASEVAPFSKTGGLADVSGALPRELARAGHEVRVFTPLYDAIDRGRHRIVPFDPVRRVAVALGRRTYFFSLATTESPTPGHRVFLVDCPELFGRGEIYSTAPDEPQRFALFSRAVFESCQRMRWAPEVLHCHDWHTALIPLLRKTVYAWDDAIFGGCRTMLTIHNLGYQGLFGADVVDAVGLGDQRALVDQDDLSHGRFNFLRTGLLHADLVSTVSPTYAREIQTAAYGMGLAPLLRARGDRLVGILNGVDHDEWDPESDPFLPHHFSANNLAGKRLIRRDLLERLRLSDVADAPLVAIVSRLVPQKGFDIAFPVLPPLLAGRRIGLVVLGQGDAHYHDFFAGLERRFSGRVVFHQGYSTELAHVIEAAADIFLMPSQYEPCGLNQLFSLRYGTIPLVRRTGGLADSVEHFDGRANSGTGFVFEHYTSDGLAWALEQALATFGDKPRWRRLVVNAMSVDFSWRHQAQRYVETYERLTGG
ncbi:MAG TPA: glycogen synthase [Candidatus Polarisedimenticolaceae bacterium]|nr:glycogen synthase [Candidatus Polarisedimenticolaceae bacterium]